MQALTVDEARIFGELTAREPWQGAPSSEWLADHLGLTRPKARGALGSLVARGLVDWRGPAPGRNEDAGRPQVTELGRKVAAGEAEAPPAAEPRADLLELLRGRPMRLALIIEESGLTRGTVHHHLNTLRSTGDVINQAGTWRLATKAERAAHHALLASRGAKPSEWREPAPAKAKPYERREAIRGLLDKGGVWTVTQVAEDLGISVESARNHLRALEGAGHARETPGAGRMPGRWRSTAPTTGDPVERVIAAVEGATGSPEPASLAWTCRVQAAVLRRLGEDVRQPALKASIAAVAGQLIAAVNHTIEREAARLLEEPA